LLLQLSVLRAQLGSLNHVKRLVKATGFVNSIPDFTSQPEVMNGFSETMIEVFGERGKAARSAVVGRCTLCILLTHLLLV
jgi:enamine deaminase RidA (YjgF/YER057c/UK114 family)